MSKFMCIGLLLVFLAIPGQAMEFTAPLPPEDAQALMPVETESFGEGLWEIIQNAIAQWNPEITQAAKCCSSVFVVVMLSSVLKGFPGGSGNVVELAGAVTVGMLLLSQTNSMVHLSVQTVQQLSDYGKLLVPVLTAATAAQGGSVTSVALYTGTTMFNAVLLSLINRLLIPMVYIYLALSVANGAASMQMVQNVRNFVKWLMTWSLKILLYVFTGYMGITKVVSGTTDAAKLKATKLTISGMVPVVGGILADASEAVIVGAGVMKSAVGVYGVLAVAAIWISPFLQIGIPYLMLKLTAGVCQVFEVKKVTGVIQDFSTAMGFLLGITGTVCILLLISTVCFMKGVS